MSKQDGRRPPPPQSAGSSLKKAARRFSSNRRGATAVEFALVVAPFLFILFAIFEISIIFLVSMTLESATARAARSIRVGTTTSATGMGTYSGTTSSNATSVNAFRTQICNNMGWLTTQCNGFTNTTGLVVDIRDPDSFADGTTTTSAITNGTLTQYDKNRCFYSGQAGGDIVIVRAYYPWTLLIPYLNLAFPKLSNGQIVLSDTEVFMIEPNTTTDSSSTTC